VSGGGALSPVHPGRLATAAVRSLSPYVPGKPIGELEREYGVRDIAKLASNENPYGPSPRALEAMHAALSEAWLYPDASAHEFKAVLARHLGVASSQITVGNGSNELLLLLAEAFLDADRSAVCSQYGFAIYPLVIRATGARCIETPALPADAPMPYGHDLAAMAAAVAADTRLLFIADPNNPTGTWVDRAALRALLRALPGDTIAVLDEAYFEYANVDGGIDDCVGWLPEFPNLVVLRTFSKGYGLAGVRVGYAVSHPEVADALNRIRPAFNVSNVAQAGAAAAIADQAYMLDGARRIVAERERVAGALRALRVDCAPSAANFLMADLGERAPQIYEQLLRGGLIVRPLGGYGLPRHLRVSIGLPEQNERLLAQLRALR